ncbi:MAG: DctP family TRAP transporter solute-binding subunit [Rubricella sp.]
MRWRGMMKRATCMAAIAAGLGAAPALAECDPGEEVIRFAHVTAERGHPKGEAALLLSERINSELDGRACMIVYPNAELYDDDEALAALLSGDLEMAAPSLSKFEQYTLSFRIFDLPFLFEDIFAVEEFQQSEAGQSLLAPLEEAGLIGLEYWHNGMKQMSANVPLELPGDAEGLAFRVQASEVLIAQMEALGGEAVPMAFSQVRAALEDGTVDGQENTWSNIYSRGFYEVQDGVTETNHGILDYLVVTSAEWWNGLDPDLRADLEFMLLEVTHERNRFAYEINEMNRISIVQNGGVIRTLTAEQRAAWEEVFQPVWDQFEPQIGAELIEAARAAEGGF